MRLGSLESSIDSNIFWEARMPIKDVLNGSGLTIERQLETLLEATVISPV